jgi:hypothetical protein
LTPRTRRAAAVLAASAVAAPAAAAQAAPIKVTGAESVVTLDGPAVQTLTSNGVGVSAVGPATLDGASATFPVRGGRLNARITKGVVRHAGGIRFTKEGRSLVVRRPVTVVAGNAAFLAVRRNGTLVRVFRLRGLARSTADSAVTVTGDLHVTRRLAKQVNRRLGTSIAQGAKAGTITSQLTY